MRKITFDGKFSLAFLKTGCHNRRAVFNLVKMVGNSEGYTQIVQCHPVVSFTLLNALHAHAGDKISVQMLKILFVSKIQDYLKNHWTNTRPVCTHLNAFFIQNPNMAMEIWISHIFSLSSALDIQAERACYNN